MSATVVGMSWEVLYRAERAMNKTIERLIRATTALDQANIPYAVVGGHAVAAWVASIDESAVRTTRDVDLLVRRADLAAITIALEQAGFQGEEVLGLFAFRDLPQGKLGEGVHLLFEKEIIRTDYPIPSPEIAISSLKTDYKVIELPPLVTMKLLAFRRKDQVHILDMMGVGLIDVTWLDRVPPMLRDRLHTLLNDPNG